MFNPSMTPDRAGKRPMPSRLTQLTPTSKRDADIPIVCRRCGGILRVALKAIQQQRAHVCPTCKTALALSPGVIGLGADAATRMANAGATGPALSEFPTS